jgi:hypothetical protein
VLRLCILIRLASAPVIGAISDRDSHHMTEAERATFVGLRCRDATKGIGPGVYRCSRLIGYPRDTAALDFRLAAVAYGAFTRAGADQAYVTYYSLLEAHMFDFGGGVLFDRRGDGWKLVRWYRGGQMDRCVALPGSGIVRMLCLSAYTQEGEQLTMVSVRAVRASARESWDSALPVQAGGGSDVFRLLISAVDTRNVNSNLSKASQHCGALSEYQQHVLSIDTLRRSARPGFFAQSEATYITAKQDYEACVAHAWGHMKGTNMTIYYALRNGEVKVESPIAIGRAGP